MFEHFTFGARPQTRLLDDAFPSPTDTSLPLIPSPTSFPFDCHSSSNPSDLNEIVAKLQQQSLQQRSRAELVKRFQTWQAYEPTVLEVDDVESEQRSETASLPSSPTSSTLPTLLCRRLQRQFNVQLQSCETHVRDIDALVEDMISSNSQCRVLSRGKEHAPSLLGRERLEVDPGDQMVDDVDEGFFEGEVDAEEDLEMGLRRASAPSGIRKHHERYAGRGEYVNVGGRIKVRSVPRMRKRKVQAQRKE